MPRRMRSRIADSELQAGPMVQMILARRCAQVADGFPAARSEPPGARSSLLGFNSSSPIRLEVYGFGYCIWICTQWRQAAFAKIRITRMKAPAWAVTGKDRRGGLLSLET